MRAIVLITTFFALNSYGQNLVPNGSFEDLVQCPEPNDYMENCQFWWSSKGTSDHFHSCATSPCIQTPSGTCFGFQVPLEGESYGGFTAYRSIESDYREHMAIELTETLEIGNTYYFSMYISRGDKDGYGLASNNQGILLTTYDVMDYNASPVPNYAHFNNQEIVTDTLNWLQLKGVIIPDSAYSHLIIGNFFDDANTDTLQVWDNITEAYYAVDEVRLSTDSTYAFEPLVTSIGRTSVECDLFPNPARNLVEFTCSTNASLFAFYDLQGKLIQETTPNQTTPLNISFLEAGTYLVLMHLDTGVAVRRLIKIDE